MKISTRWTIVILPSRFPNLGDEWKFLPTGIQEQMNFHERTRGKINKDHLFCFLYLTLLYVVNNNDHDNRKYKHSRYVMSKIHTRHTSSSTHHQPLSSPQRVLCVKTHTRTKSRKTGDVYKMWRHTGGQEKKVNFSVDRRGIRRQKQTVFG